MKWDKYTNKEDIGYAPKKVTSAMCQGQISVGRGGGYNYGELLQCIQDCAFTLCIDLCLLLMFHLHMLITLWVM